MDSVFFDVKQGGRMVAKRAGETAGRLLAPPAARRVEGCSVGSLGRGLDVLGAFRPGEGALRNGDIAIRVGLPKATVSRLTCSLWEAGYLEYDRRSGAYELAAKVLTLGFTVLSNQRILPAAHEQMRRLANQSGCTVSLASPDGHAMVYLDRCTGETMPYFLGIGSATEMVRTAGGRAYIAGLSDASRRELYGRLAPIYADEWSALLPALEGGV